MFLTPEFGGMSGGIGTSMLVLARALHAKGIRVSVVTRMGPETSRLENYAVTELHCSPGHLARWTFRARAGVHSQHRRPDVIHAPEWNAAAVVAAAFNRVPVVTRLDTPSYLVRELSGVTESSTRQKLVERAERYQAQRSRVVLAASEQIGAVVARRWALKADKVRLLRNPIEVDVLRTMASTPEVLAGISTGVVFSGRLEPRKGISILLPLIEMVLTSRLAPVTIVGSLSGLDQVAMSRLSSFARRFPSTFRVLGVLPHAQALRVVACSDLVIVPSVWENAPLVVMEAMALGRPVIASAAGGILELIDDGRDGILVDSRSPRAWFNTIERILTQKELRRNIGDHASDRAKEWDAPLIANSAMAFYEEAIRSA